MNRDIISEIYSYLDSDTYNALSLVNKLFYEVSNHSVMDPLYDQFNYSKKRNRRFGRRYVNIALETHTKVISIINEKYIIEHKCRYPTTEINLMADTQIIEEYFPFDKTWTCRIKSPDPTIIGFRHLKLAMTTRDPLDVNNINLIVFIKIGQWLSPVK
jgi:hypothetical protein